MKACLRKIAGFFIFAISLIAMCSMSVSAATAQDYENFGESLSPFLIIGIIGLVVLLIKRKK